MIGNLCLRRGDLRSTVFLQTLAPSELSHPELLLLSLLSLFIVIFNNIIIIYYILLLLLFFKKSEQVMQIIPQKNTFKNNK